MFMRVFVVAAAFVCGAALPAHANMRIEVDKNHQRMSVLVDGQVRYRWAVSTGRASFGTPNGTFRPIRMERTWFSKEYYDSPMPYSIFFHRGYAIHGSYEISRLGGPASHGCVRLHPSNAATLFALVKREGMGNTVIQVSGKNPAPRPRRALEPEADAPEGGEGGTPPTYMAPRYVPPTYEQRPFFTPFYSPGY